MHIFCKHSLLVINYLTSNLNINFASIGITFTFLSLCLHICTYFYKINKIQQLINTICLDYSKATTINEVNVPVSMYNMFG